MAARSLRYALLLGCLCTALALAAQEPEGTVQVAPSEVIAKTTGKHLPPTGRITGIVLCSDTHRPARGAMLMTTPVPAADGSTPNVGGNSPNISHVGLDGSYSVEQLGPGEYSIMAILPGYITRLDEMVSGNIENSTPASIREQLLRGGTITITGGETERYDLSLQRGAAISGHILFSDGAPASQVSIDIEDIHAKKITGPYAALAKMGETMGRTMFTHQSQNTDDQGRFRISGLKPGTYRVAAVSSLSTTEDTSEGMGGIVAFLGGSFDAAALRVYSGNTLHVKDAKTYELRSGDEVSGVDITIPLNAYHQVRGVLTAVDGRSVNKATIALTDATDDSVTFQTEVTEQGSFAFATVAAGTYTLSAKDAKIVARQEGSNPDMPLRYGATKITNVFADGTTSVIVKDSDLPDVTFNLTEVPLPPDANKPPTTDPND